ncbi:MAG TPA: hypothetical protein VGH28_05155 [Polyangiaceae bacterium]|jgi:hypothetical protein
MSKNSGKLIIAAVLASSGFVAFACGGGSEEGKGTQTPSASATETATAPGSETASATAAPTATTPPAPTLPDSFKTADDARKTAEGKIATITAKKGTCSALAKDVTKLGKDNASAYQTWNSEYAKLDDAQKGIVTTKAPTADDITAAFDTGTTKTCVDKKDKTFAAALKTYATAAMAMPGAGAAAPATSGSAAPKKK